MFSTRQCSPSLSPCFFKSSHNFLSTDASWALLYSAKNVLACDQSVIGIYHIRNAYKTKTRKRTSMQLSLCLADKQCLQFTDLRVFLYVTLGSCLRHCRQLSRCRGGRKSMRSVASTLWFRIHWGLDARDEGARCWLNSSSVSKQTATTSNVTVSCSKLSILGWDCLMNGSSTMLVTKRKQSTGTHFGKRALCWQLLGGTHMFAGRNGQHLLNIQ